MKIEDLLKEAIDRKASDLHLMVDFPPVLRVNGSLFRLSTYPLLTSEEVEKLVFSVTTPEQKELIISNRELDFSINFEKHRFRINAYYQRGTLSAAFRLISFDVPTIEKLNLPKICHTFATLAQGFILIVGPTGHGKTTAAASIINEINLNDFRHIVTIEDPIEYIFPKGKGLVSQREIKNDSYSWQVALRSALRQDPDVVFIGEMRDSETIASALTIAETGHLVFSTLHTNSAAQTIDRIVDSFPENQQSQVKIQLAAVLEAVLSLRLLPCLSGGRIPACEIMVATQAVKSLIREGKTYLIDNIIQTSKELGMQTLEESLVTLVKEGKVALEDAQRFANRPEEVMRLIKKPAK